MLRDVTKSTVQSVIADLFGSVWSILSIFAASEPGWMYDNSDMSTMFQDSAGTTPVTAVGQPVGLQLDKKQGLVLGPELATNGNFSDGLTGWVSGSAIASSIVSGEVQITFGGSADLSANNWFSQAGDLPSTTAFYKVTFDATWVSGGILQLSSGFDVQTTISANAGKTSYSVIVRRGTSGTAANQQALVFAGATGAVWKIDNISIKELAGTHRTQSTAASRPTFARLPVTGRRNLLVNTPFAGAVAGSPGTIPTSWTLDINNATIALPSTDVIQISAVGQRTVFRQSFTVNAAEVFTYNCAVEVVSGTIAFNQIFDLTMFAGPTYTYYMDGVSVTATTTVPVGLHNLRVTVVNDATGRTIGARLGVGVISNSTAVVKYSNPQFEAGSPSTNYQKVVSLYDITEAGVQTAYGLYYDGVDDFLVTPTITPGTDKVQVFAGVRKLSDAAAGLVVGNYLSTSTNGSFELNAPRTANSNYGFLIRGDTANAQYSMNNFASPVSSVISAACDISGATIAEEIKPRVNGSIPTLAVASAGPAGGGNFLAYPVYFGRRGGTTLPFNGYTFREIGRFGPNLDAATIANVENWINQNTGAY